MDTAEGYVDRGQGQLCGSGGGRRHADRDAWRSHRRADVLAPAANVPCGGDAGRGLPIEEESLKYEWTWATSDWNTLNQSLQQLEDMGWEIFSVFVGA
jgi:hypothetical protein